MSLEVDTIKTPNKNVGGLRRNEHIPAILYSVPFMRDKARKITHKQFRRLWARRHEISDAADYIAGQIDCWGSVILCDGKKEAPADSLFSYRYGEYSRYVFKLSVLKRGVWKQIVFPRTLSVQEAFDLARRKIDKGRPIRLTRAEKRKFDPLLDTKVPLKEFFREIRSFTEVKKAGS